MVEKEKSYKIVFLCTLMMGLLLGICVHAQAATPQITEAKLITSQDIELQWDQNVTGAGDYSIYTVTVDGKQVDINRSEWWPEYEPGVVYYNNKTSIQIKTPISDVNHLPEIEVTIQADKIQNSSGEYVSQLVVPVTTYDAFYQQEITLDCGVKILGTAAVRPEAMTKAEEMLEVVLANESLATRMGELGCKLGIYGEGEIAYDIPEHRYTYDEAYLYVEGFGGTQLASIKDANVLRLTTGTYTTGYVDESILVHEFGHTVKNFGFTEDQATRFEAIYEKSIAAGKWANSYAGSNADEFFATLSAIWFNVMNESWDGTWDGVRGPVNTREELKTYDEDAYNFMAEIYVSDQYLPSPWENGSVANNYNIDGTIVTSTPTPTETPEPTDTPTPTPTPAAVYKVVFDYGNHDGIYAVKVTSGKTVSKPKNPTRTGYTFAGWYNGSKKFSFTTRITGDVTLKAKWTKVKVAKATIKSARSKVSGKATVKVKTVSKAKGYQYTYSTSRKFTKKTTKNTTSAKTQVVLKKLKKGTTCYVKVRAYKLDSKGKKVYGKYSTVKKMKVQ